MSNSKSEIPTDSSFVSGDKQLLPSASRDTPTHEAFSRESTTKDTPNRESATSNSNDNLFSLIVAVAQKEIRSPSTASPRKRHSRNLFGSETPSKRKKTPGGLSITTKQDFTNVPNNEPVVESLISDTSIADTKQIRVKEADRVTRLTSRLIPRETSGLFLSQPIALLSKDKWKSIQIGLGHVIQHDTFRRFCSYEWFYSAIDQLYFSHNEFSSCLNELGLGRIPKLSRTEWSYVRSLMGKPRRLSKQFFEEERNKLHKYRSHVRAIQMSKRLGKHFSEVGHLITEGIPAELQIGQRVTALHSQTGELHTGSINMCEDNKYKIQFDQSELPDLWVTDSAVMPHGSFDVLFHSSPTSVSSSYGNNNSTKFAEKSGFTFPLQKNDIRLLNRLYIILLRKEKIVGFLREMNLVAETILKETQNKNTTNMNIEVRSKTNSPFPKLFLQEYAWIIYQIERTNQMLEPALRALRYRVFATTSCVPDPLPSSSPEPPLSIQVYKKCQEDAKQLCESVYKQLINDSHSLSDTTISGTNTGNLIISALTLILLIKYSVDRGIPSSEFDSALEQLYPKSPLNLKSYESITDHLRVIKAFLSDSSM